MIKEKKTLLISKIVFGVLLLAGVIAAIIMYLSPKDIDVIDVDIEGNYFVATFTDEVIDADITIEFYDSHNMKVDEKVVHFGENNDEPTLVLRARIPNVDDSAVSYAPTWFECTYESDLAMLMYILILVDVILLACFIQTLIMSCKIYDYNGREILVYAGWFRRYLKVDGVKVAERGTAFTYGTINLVCALDDGSQVLATITRMNRVSLYINNQYWNEIKK